MSHVRQQIRSTVAQILTDLPTTGNRVFVSRVYPLEKTALPGLIIMADKDEADYSQTTSSNGHLKILSHLQLIVRAYAKGTVGVDDKLDQIELEVRQALMANRTINGSIKDINWQSSVIEIIDGGEQIISTNQMLFIVSYRIIDENISVALT